MKKFILLSFVASIFVSCASVDLNVSRDEAIDLAQYQTYNLHPDMNTGLDTADLDHALQILHSRLQERGLTMAEEPDVWVDLKSMVHESEREANFGAGFPRASGNGGGATFSSQFTTVGIDYDLAVVLSIIDRASNKQVWSAQTEQDIQPGISSDELGRLMQKALDKSLANLDAAP
jgi:hypothetical protein